MTIVKQVLRRQVEERNALMRRSLREISEVPDNWSPRYASGRHATKHIPEHSGGTDTAEDGIGVEDAAWRQAPGFRPEGL